ncbi:hypothetical protein P8452_48355 [Trifolium repens]|nr:hypothetical protein P8452_48355 [Trifolium repens]
MLQICPKLQTLSISKCRNSRTTEDWNYPDHVPECVSSHLTTCKIIDYEPVEADFRFATYILQNARLLQRERYGTVSFFFSYGFSSFLHTHHPFFIFSSSFTMIHGSDCA